MRRKMLALALTAGALTIPATPVLADPDFGPGNSSKGLTTLAPSVMPLVMAPALGPMNRSLAARAS